MQILFDFIIAFFHLYLFVFLNCANFILQFYM